MSGQAFRMIETFGNEFGREFLEFVFGQVALCFEQSCQWVVLRVHAKNGRMHAEDRRDTVEHVPGDECTFRLEQLNFRGREIGAFDERFFRDTALGLKLANTCGDVCCKEGSIELSFHAGEYTRV